MDLKREHIFILGTTKFDGPDQSTSFSIATELAKKNHVYYVDYPITWKDYITRRKTDQIKKRKAFFSPFSDGLIETDNNNLKVIITPPLASINFLPEGRIYRALLAINEAIIRARIKKVLTRFSIRRFIFINSFNFHYPRVADQLNPALTVYHCVDPMIIDYDKKHGIISEAELVKKSDLVICTSRQLIDEKILQNPNTHFIPNAADLTQSIKALEPKLEINEHLKNLKRPIIGYAGSIERRLDYELIKRVVELNPEKTFVFAGSISKEFVPDWFFEQHNLVLTGRLPFTDMPGLLKGFDVAVIPFKKDEVSRTIFPLKLFEYLGAGKPVVATHFNSDLREFTQDTVSYCEDAEEFTRALNMELSGKDDQSKMTARIQVASENTWEKRGEEMAKLLAKNLNYPKSGL